MRYDHALLCALAVWGLAACGESEEVGPANTEVLHPDAPPLPGQVACTVVEVTSIAVKDAIHVPTCTHVKYRTNPPSGGDHWPVWAAFKEYGAPVPREMYVHNQEHGGVILAYRCNGDCDEVVDALRSVQKAAKDDACDEPRIVLTPDPDLLTPIAAGAWGATYTATCIDTPSLAAFVASHIGKGTEEVCADGADVSTSAPCPN